jgi:hypothetical protein
MSFASEVFFPVDGSEAIHFSSSGVISASVNAPTKK